MHHQSHPLQDLSRLQCFSSQRAGHWQQAASTPELLGGFESRSAGEVDERKSGANAEEGMRPGSADDKAVRATQTLYYHVENLRKRLGAED